METVGSIIDKTYHPKPNLTERDNKILRNRLSILAEMYFCETNKQKWAIVALSGSVASLEMSIKSVLFDVKKRSDMNFDIQVECNNFITNHRHILNT